MQKFGRDAVALREAVLAAARETGTRVGPIETSHEGAFVHFSLGLLPALLGM